jgi:3-methyladenine DNA glycosylase AlkD
MKSILDEIRKNLSKNSDAKTKESGEKFFREEVKMYGVKSSLIHSIGKDMFRKLPDKSKSIVFKICEDLLKSGLMEESIIACDWSYSVQKQYTIDDFEVFETWVNKYVTNWATCDTLCNHSVGSLVVKYPACLSGLKEWAKSDNRWMRRASAVTLIIPARHGKFLNEIFELSDIMLTDKDDMVQKGYGWMLKAASEAHQKQVFDYVVKNKNIMPRTSLRYAIEKMPANLKAMAMEKPQKGSLR